MNNSNSSNPYYNANSFSHKKRGHAPFDDVELSTSGLPRKRFISEESVARDMAAMSLNSFNSNQTPQQQQQQHYYLDRGTFPSYSPQPQETCHNSSNVVRVDDINQFLSDDDDNQIDIDPHRIFRDANGRTLVENFDGLPLELKPGESKPRIPDFVLDNSELTDPRDLSAYQSVLKSLSRGNRTTYIEVLNHPTVNHDPSSMDID